MMDDDNDTDYGVEPDQGYQGGFVTVYGPCVLCRQMFAFHPHHVPSTVVNGQREPMCESCFRQVQAAQRRNGLPVTPEPPSDAWEGNMPESEL